jgi:pseudouridine synthase
VCSREEALRWIAAGRVRVNGARARDARAWVDLEHDAIEVDGRPLARPAPLVLVMNKPLHFLTTRSDERRRKTVYELLPTGTPWVVPVGRLDRDTRGLLLQTNDTDLAAALTDPGSRMEKLYVVELAAAIADEGLALLRRGLLLDDGPTRPARARRLAPRGGRPRIELALTEGRNREVRRMVRTLGSHVVALERVAVGPLRLGGLAPGAVRALTPAEERRLRAAL